MSGADVSTTLNLNTRADTSGTQAMTSALAALQQQMGTMSTVMAQMSQASGQLAQAFNNLAKSTQGEQDALAKGGDALNQHKDATDKASQSTSAFTQMIGAHATQIIGLGAAYLSIRGVLELVGQGFEFITSAAEAAIGRMEQFLEQSFQLSQEAQQMEYLWGYQYGGPQGGGTQIASQLQAWIPNFAMNSPYTMMQIMGAVGPLSQLGLSFQGLQRYLPLISDLAATHTSIFGGGGMLPLPYAALAVMEATKGYSRRLLMELQIRPNELEPYGVKFVGNKDSGQIANPEMFLPALEAYAKDKGYTGASKKMAHESVTGLEASLQDRFQSFMRRTMGEDIPDPNAGDLSQSVLDLIKKGDINGAMKLAGADAASLKSYGVTFGKNGAMTSSASDFQDALEKFSEDKFYASRANTPEFRKDTIFSVILKGLQDFSAFWDSHQSMLDKVSKFVADVGGKFLEVGAQGVSSFGNAFGSAFVKKFNGTQWQQLGNDFMQWISDPHNQQLLKQAGDYIGTELAQDIDLLASGIDNLRKGWDNLPQEWKDGGANFLGFAFDKAAGAINSLVIFMSVAGAGMTELGHIAKTVGAWFEEHNPFALWNNELFKAGKLTGDLIELMIDFKKVLSGDFNPNAILDVIDRIKKDMQSLLDASTNKDGTHSGGPGFSGGVPAGTPTGHGTNVSPNAYAASISQTNFFTVNGASGGTVQQIVDSNERKLASGQNLLARMPGSLSYNAIGLF